MSRIKSILVKNFKEIDNISIKFRNDVSIVSRDNLEEALEYFNSNTISSKDQDTLVSVAVIKDKEEVIFLSSIENLQQETQINVKKFENGEEVEINKLSNGQYSFVEKTSNQIDSEYIYNEIVSKLPKNLLFKEVDKLNETDEEVIFYTEKKDFKLIELLNKITIGRLALGNNSFIIEDEIEHPLLKSAEKRNTLIDKSLAEHIIPNGIFSSLEFYNTSSFIDFDDIVELKPNSLVLFDENKKIKDANKSDELNIELFSIESKKLENLNGEIEIIKQLNRILNSNNLENNITLFELKQENEFLKSKIDALESSTNKLSKENEGYISIVNNAERKVKNLEAQLSECGKSPETEDIKNLLLLALKLIDSKEDSTKELIRKLWISIGDDIKK